MGKYFGYFSLAKILASSDLLSGIVQGLLLAFITVAIAQARLTGQSQMYKSPLPRGENIAIDVGPYVQFTGPFTAVVHWDTPVVCDSIVEYWATESLGLRAKDTSVTTTHENPERPAI